MPTTKTSEPTAPADATDPTPPETHAAPRVQRFDFAWDPWFRVPAFALGVTPMNAFVKVSSDQLRVRFGRWRMDVDRDEIADVGISGPYLPWRVLGPPRLSFRDRGITFGTNRDLGVCITLRTPLPGIEPTGRIRHPGITLTVDEVEELAELLTR